MGEGFILTLLIFLPSAGMLFLWLIPSEEKGLIKNISLIWSLIPLALSIYILNIFQQGYAGFQFVESYRWIPSLNISYTVGLDGISIFLVILTVLSVSIVILSSYNYITQNEKLYYSMVLFLESAMLGTFTAMDLILFFLFWEAMLVPMYFIIAIWGGERRIYATFKFILYTSIGSVLMLIGILYLGRMADSFYLEDIYKITLTYWEQLLLFGAFFLSFAIKVPLFPVHTWLPDAHVEAPTGGSVILAAILLKMGAYGFIRFVIPLFPLATSSLAPVVLILSVIGIIYAAMASFVQKDIKRLVAYSSVSHMGLIVLGIFALNKVSMTGAIYQMLSHGLSTGTLFLIVGMIYERRHTREISEFGGIASVMPAFATFFMIATLTSIAVPFTSGFVGEFMVLLGSFSSTFIVDIAGYGRILVILAATGMVFGAVYMLWAYQKVVFGPNLKEENRHLLDLSIREYLVLIPSAILMVVMGVHTSFLTTRIMPSVERIIEIFNAGLK